MNRFVSGLYDKAFEESQAEQRRARENGVDYYAEQEKFTYCPNCSAKVRKTAKFCYFCEEEIKNEKRN